MVDTGADSFQAQTEDETNSLAVLRTQLLEDGYSFRLEKLLELWFSSQAIEDFLSLATTNSVYVNTFTSEGKEISLNQLRDFSLIFLALLHERAARHRILSLLMGSPNAEAREVSRLLRETAPEEVFKLVPWLNGLVIKITQLLRDSDQILERYLGYLEYNKLMGEVNTQAASSEASTEDTAAGSDSGIKADGEPAHQTTRVTFDDDDPIVEPELLPPAVPAPPEPVTAKVFTPNSAPAPIITTTTAVAAQSASELRPYQILSIHNAFARNDVARRLLQLYRVPADQDRPWDYLTPQLKYLISRDLQAYLFTLNEQQLKQFNRESFVESFFQDFRQRHPFILQPEFALLQPNGIETPDSAEAPLAENTPPPALSANPEADQALEQVQGLGQGQFFNQDMAGLEKYFLDQLERQKLEHFEAENIQSLLHYIPAIGEDPNLVLYGSSREELVALFPFLGDKSDTQLTEILHQAELYAWRHSGLLANTLGRPVVAIPQTDLPSAEVAERFTNAQNLTVGIAHDDQGSSHLQVVVDAASSSTGFDDKYQGVNATIALNTSAAENQALNPVFQNVNRRVFQPVYRNNQDVITTNRKIEELQLSIYEEILNSIHQRQFELMRLRLNTLNQQHHRVMSIDEALVAFNERISKTHFGQFANNLVPGLAQITPYDLLSEMQAAGRHQRQQLAPLQRLTQTASPQNWLRNFNQYRRARNTVNTLRDARQTINKTRMLADVLIKAKKTAEAIKTALSLGQIALAAQGVISAIMASPVGLLIGGAAALLGGVSLLSGLTNAASAAQGLSGQAASKLTSGLRPEAANAKIGTNQGVASSQGADSSGNIVGKISEGTQNFLTSATPGASATIGIGGMGVMAVVGIATMQSNFFKPLNMKGEESPYIDVTKTAIYNGQPFTEVKTMNGDIEVTYQITITPKDEYILDIESLEDTQSVDFNTTKLEADGRDIPTIPILRRTYITSGGEQNPDFADDLDAAKWPTQPVLKPGESLVIEYQQTFTPQYMDSTVFNQVAITFDATSVDPEVEDAAIGETVTFSHRICFGECPVISSANACWPTHGVISQHPFDSPAITSGPGSHRPGPVPPQISTKGLDAYDIALTAAEINDSEPNKVYAPFDGRLCPRSYDSGYGTYVVLDQVAGAPFDQLIFAHLDRSIFGTDTGQCIQVTRGEEIGDVGSSGNSSGPHLHYGVSPITAGTSVVRTLVPNGDTVAINDEVGTESNICRANGS